MEGKESKPKLILGAIAGGDDEGSTGEDTMLVLFFFGNWAWRGVVRHLEEVLSPRVLVIVWVLSEGRDFSFSGFSGITKKMKREQILLRERGDVEELDREGRKKKGKRK